MKIRRQHRIICNIYNFLYPEEKIKLEEERAACFGNEACIEKVEEPFKELYNERARLVHYWDFICQSRGLCTEFNQWHIELRKQLTEEGIDYYLKHPDEFVLSPFNETAFHNQQQDSDGNPINLSSGAVEGMRKYVHPILGYEVVIDANNNIVTDPLNMGTYNYVNAAIEGLDLSKLVASKWGHFRYDIAYYGLFGNNEHDPSTFFDRFERGLYALELMLEDKLRGLLND